MVLGHLVPVMGMTVFVPTEGRMRQKDHRESRVQHGEQGLTGGGSGSRIPRAPPASRLLTAWSWEDTYPAPFPHQ